MIGVGPVELVLIGAVTLLALAVWVWAVVDAVRAAIACPGVGEMGLLIAVIVGGPPVALLYLLLRLTFWSERWERRQDRRRTARASAGR